MSTDPKAGSGGTDPNAAGGGSDDQKDKNVVKYETHEKLLTEKKKLDKENADLAAKLKTFEAEKADSEKKDLEKKGELQKLLELERAEKKSLQDKLKDNDEMLARGSKLQAVLESINGKIEQQYWPLIDLADVIIDPKTGTPDETSVKAAVKAFETKYPLVIQTKSGGSGLPNDAARGGGKLTYEQWLALPLEDQRKRLKEVYPKAQ